MTVKLNQDASADATVANAKSTNSAEWAAQFNTPQFPWPEAPFPSFYKEVPNWNQEMIRRARTGNTNARLSVWDRKNNCWMSAAEAEKKATPLKSVHLNNLGASDSDTKMANGDAESHKSDEDSDANDSSNESNKSGDDDDEDGEEGAPFNLQPTTSSKRRKLASRLHGADDERLIEVKKWVQLPANVAEKTPDRSFLASRRPGMPPLYNPEYATKLFGRYHSSSTISGTAGYDLGEGGGLANASGVLASGTGDATAGTATPPRKNIPPRRKKKKLGGPGRRKANPNPVPQPAGAEGAETAATVAVGADGEPMQGVQSAEGQATENEQSKNETGEGDDNNDSGSEAEGSEEGEIDETGGAGSATPQPPPRQPTPTTAVESALAAPPISVEAAVHEEVPAVSDATVPQAPPAEPAVEEAVKEEAMDGVLPTTEIASVEAPQTVQPEKVEVTETDGIPGLGGLIDPTISTDPEEKQIIEENAQAISSTDQPSQELISGVSEALTGAVAAGAALAEPVAEITEVEQAEQQKPQAEGGVEVDLLGGLDEAIDRGMSEGGEKDT